MLPTKWLFLISFFVIYNCAYSKIAPDYIILCPGLKSECLKRSIQETIPYFAKGLPSLGINTTDPLYKKRLDWELPGGLKVEFTEGTMTGLRNCIVDSVKFEGDGLEVYLKVTCNLALKGKYKASGRILIFSLDGDGEAKIKSPSITLSVKTTLEDKPRNGVMYREIKEYIINKKYNEKVIFNITNLFKGNTEISQAILKFLNDNWQLMINDFGQPIIDSLIDIAMDHIKIFFHSVPRDEIFVN